MSSTSLLDQARRQWAAYLSDLWRSGDWDEQPKEERNYAQRNLAAHLDEAGGPDEELYALLDERWLRAWWALEETFEGFLGDVDRAWLRAERACDLVAQIKCGLCAAGGSALSANVPPELLALAVEHEVLTPDQALGIVRRADEADRAPMMIALAPHIPPRYFNQALDVAESLTLVYNDIKNRNDVLAALAPHIPPLLQARAVELANSISSANNRAKAIADLAPHVADEQVDFLLACARGIERGGAGAVALSAVAARLEGADYQSVAREAYEVARSVDDDEDRADALAAMLGTVREPVRSRVFRSALTTARNMSVERIASYDAREDADLRAEKLADLLPHVTGSRQQRVLAGEVLTAIQRMHSGERSSLLQTAMPHLPKDLVPQALRVALSVDGFSLPYALDAVAGYLTPRQVSAAVAHIRKVRSLLGRAKALVPLARRANGPLRGRLADAIFALARRLHDNDRAEVLAEVAPLMRPAAIGPLLQCAQQIRVVDARSRALSKIVAFLPADLQAVAVAEAWKTAGTDHRQRLDTLTSVLPLASGTLRSRLEKARPSLLTAAGASLYASDAILAHARMLLTLNRVDDAFAAIVAVEEGEQRSEAFARLARDLPADHRVRAIRAALETARATDDKKALTAFMSVAEGRVDLDDLSCQEQLMARAGFYAEDEDDGDEDEDEEDDEEDDESKSGARHLEGESIDLAAEIERAKGMTDERKRAEALRTLALVVPEARMDALLDMALLVKHEDSRCEALEAMVKRLAPQHWPHAFEVAESIDDDDERTEAWIAIARYATDAHKRVAQERGLEAIARAFNEDDYHEPLLRLAVAEDFPSDLFPRVMEVAADLHQQEDEERRARAFTGLAQDFRLWVTRDRAAAYAGWSDALRRMARRPRPDFLHDLAGFHHLGRLLVGPKREKEYIRSLRAMVKDVCAWR
jgi:hypothetical protein